MGALQDLSTGERIPLLPLHRVGRSAACALVVDSHWVSREHAALAWVRDAWELRDLSSHNGSMVDGRALAAGTRAVLRLGARLSFGGADASHALVDASPPQPLAQHADGRWIEGAGELLVLSGEEDEATQVLPDGRGGWCLEVAGTTRAVRDGARVEVAGVPLQLFLPGEEVLTWRRDADDEPVARFRVSLDEEQAGLTLDEAGRAVDLGSRSHHYLLLTLARTRLTDAQTPDLPQAEHGWMDADDLAHKLRLDLRYLNVLVFRARKQAADAGLGCAHRLVERRDQSRQLRIGLARLVVER